jgi:hypothetical protein
MRSKYTKAKGLGGVKPLIYLFIAVQSICSLCIYYSQFYLVFHQGGA